MVSDNLEEVIGGQELLNSPYNVYRWFSEVFRRSSKKFRGFSNVFRGFLIFLGLQFLKTSENLLKTSENLLKTCESVLKSPENHLKVSIFAKCQQEVCKCCKFKFLPFLSMLIISAICILCCRLFSICCKTRSQLQNSVPIHPKTSKILTTI